LGIACELLLALAPEYGRIVGVVVLGFGRISRTGGRAAAVELEEVGIDRGSVEGGRGSMGMTDGIRFGGACMAALGYACRSYRVLEKRKRET